MLGRLKFDINNLVDEILDQLPSEVWSSSTTTFLDPAIGGGQFVRVIEHRLREAGHSNKNIASRVYGYESNLMRINFAVNKYKLVGTYINKDFLDEEFSMKFDVVVGNPPFQSADSSLNLWPLFTEKGIELLNDSGHIAFVTPTTWMRPSTDIKRKKELGGSKYIFKDFMQVYNTTAMNTGTVKQHFNVGSTFCWFVIEKSDYNHSTVITDINNEEFSVNLKNFKVFPNEAPKKVITIFEKLQAHKEKFNFKGIRGKGREDLNCQLVKDNVYQYKYVGSQYNKKNFSNEFNCMMWHSDTKHPDYDIPKVVINYIGDIVPYIDDGNAGFQYCQVHFLNDKNKVKGAKDLFNSKLFKLFYKFVRYGMHNEAGVLNALPKVDLTKRWSDNDLYAYFNLTDDEIKFVESYVS
jgi:site-specific DNA-methyltransferase (adenine-specific)